MRFYLRMLVCLCLLICGISEVSVFGHYSSKRSTGDFTLTAPKSVSGKTSPARKNAYKENFFVVVLCIEENEPGSLYSCGQIRVYRYELALDVSVGANGNVSAIYDLEGGAQVASYEYDPFGNVIAETSSPGLSNHYRFSTKYLDESGLYYYGYRFYDPAVGRWVNRDPIGEQGGVNVYGINYNDTNNNYDILGLLQYKPNSPYPIPFEITEENPVPFEIPEEIPQNVPEEVPELDGFDLITLPGQLIAILLFITPHSMGDATIDVPIFDLELEPEPLPVTQKVKTEPDDDCDPCKDLPTVTYYYHETFQIATHIDRAIKSGKPYILNRNPGPTKKDYNKQTDRNRGLATAFLIAIHGGKLKSLNLSIDEYPFATTMQGGATASTMVVSASEQSLQGAKMNIFYNIFPIVPYGGQFCVKVEF